MSGSLLGGLGGAAIGFLVGGPVGAQIGFAAGSMIGGLVTQKAIDGPRLNDRAVQVSTYGVMVPIVYGGVRVHGNVIWSTDLIEHTTSSGGKGGPKQNTYSYSVSLAILLAEGTMGGIVRVWADTKLVYDMSDQATEETKTASAKFTKYLVFYPGTEDQLPDPTIEAALGAGNVPAYRGCCYVVLTDIPLSDYGNRIPDFSFELSNQGTLPGVPLQIHKWATAKLYDSNTPGVLPEVAPYHYGGELIREEDGSTYEVASETHDQAGHDDVLGYGIYDPRYIGFAAYDFGGRARFPASYFINSAFGFNASLDGLGDGTRSINSPQMVWALRTEQQTRLDHTYYGSITYPIVSQVTSASAGNNIGVGGYSSTYTPYYSMITAGAQPYDGSVSLVAEYGSDGVAIGINVGNYVVGNSGIVYNRTIWGSLFAMQPDVPTSPSGFVVPGLFAFQPGTTTKQPHGRVIDAPGNPDSPFCAGIPIKETPLTASTRVRYPDLPLPVNGVQLYTKNFVQQTDSVSVYENLSTPSGTPYLTEVKGAYKLCDNVYKDGALIQKALGPVVIDVKNDPRFTHNGNFQVAVFRQFWRTQMDIAIAAGTMSAEVGNAMDTFEDQATLGVHMTTFNIPCPMYPGEAYAVADTGTKTGSFEFLSNVVLDVCARAGLPSGAVDVSDIMGITLDGYTIGKQTTARGDLIPLQQVFYWDMIESGTTLKAVRRGSKPVFDIPLGDLAASDTGTGTPVESRRLQETELPTWVNLSYAARETGYLTATQYARRSTVVSTQITTIPTAVVMPDQKAAEVAAVLLYNAWTERTTRSFQTTRKYAAAQPTDVVALEDDEGLTYTVRITSVAQDGGVMKFQAVDDFPAGYKPKVLAAPGGTGSVIVPIKVAGATVLDVLDIPILQDADDDLGYYLAAAGPSASWPGGDAFRSVDGGLNYDDTQTIRQPSTLGAAQTVLGAWPGGNTIDQQNTVTVSLVQGTLASASVDALVNGANLAILGDEIIQFQRAALLSAGVYQLSGLLRGRRGTEAAQGMHAAGERFVLASLPTLYRQPSTLADLGRPVLFKGVTAGAIVDTVTAQSFANMAIGKRPFAPAQLRAMQALPLLDIVVSWSRRTRLQTRFGGHFGSIAPLGEATEAYVARVYTGATLLRSYNVSTPTATYSATDQAADGHPTALRFEVAQLSSVVGAGTPASLDFNPVTQ